MKFQHFYDAIQIDDLSTTPKYQQLANAIISATENGVLKKWELLPSINDGKPNFRTFHSTKNA